MRKSQVVAVSRIYAVIRSVSVNSSLALILGCTLNPLTRLRVNEVEIRSRIIAAEVEGVVLSGTFGVGTDILRHCESIKLRKIGVEYKRQTVGFAYFVFVI